MGPPVQISFCERAKHARDGPRRHGQIPHSGPAHHFQQFRHVRRYSRLSGRNLDHLGGVFLELDQTLHDQEGHSLGGWRLPLGGKTITPPEQHICDPRFLFLILSPHFLELFYFLGGWVWCRVEVSGDSNDPGSMSPRPPLCYIFNRTMSPRTPSTGLT